MNSYSTQLAFLFLSGFLVQFDVITLHGEDTVQTEKKSVEELEREDLDQIQGDWERPILDAQNVVVGRAVKSIAGNVEIVTYSDRSGKVLHAHKTTIEVRRLGPVRVFLYRDKEVIDGPNKGQKTKGTGGYIYKVNKGRFTEVTSLFVGQENQKSEIRIWAKVPKQDA